MIEPSFNDAMPEAVIGVLRKLPGPGTGRRQPVGLIVGQARERSKRHGKAAHIARRRGGQRLCCCTRLDDRELIAVRRISCKSKDSAAGLRQPVSNWAVGIRKTAIIASRASQMIENVIAEILRIRRRHTVSDFRDVVRSIISIGQVLQRCRSGVAEIEQTIIEIEATRLCDAVAIGQSVDRPEGLIRNARYN